jgi:hypothetical protein
MLLHKVADLMEIHPGDSSDEYIIDELLVVETLREFYPVAVEVVQLIDARVLGNASQELAKFLSVPPHLSC